MLHPLVSGKTASAKSTFQMLPQITPQICASLMAVGVLIASSLILVRGKKKETSAEKCKDLLLAVGFSGITAFMFGWHVHEKAMLVFAIPMRYATERSDPINTGPQ